MRILLLFFLIHTSIFSNKDDLILKLSSKIAVKNMVIKGVDNLNNLYSIKNNELIKTSKEKTSFYRNNLYSNITSIDVKNSLKVKLFYENFNTLIILDNKLSEISKINFNVIDPDKIISKVSASNDNNIWIYNELNSKLELFNYVNKKIKVVNSEISGEVISLVSNYKYCWVLTDSHIFKFNYFGSLISKLKVTKIQQIENFNNTLIFKRDNQLYYYSEDFLTENKFDLGDLLIKDFFVTNQSLYIYDSEHFIKYQIQKN
ncbi:MAG: hypothetical protein ACKVJ4_03880 [Flavobacteriales bacterium]|jgi:hypothetical protein|tara:strand:- start:168 stop:947 length:780 start_codon:yes stop_codon:yes gene_type:complete